MSNLSANDLCKIIKMSRGYGVSKITMGEISIEFGLEPIAQTLAPKNKMPIVSKTEPAQQDLPFSQQEENNNSLEELLYLNPYEYEQRVKKGLFNENHSTT